MNENAMNARAMLESGGYTCVLCRGNAILTDKRRGVRPLLDLLDSRENFVGYSAADKVVGKAAAFLYQLLGVEFVYAQVISQPALDVLTHFGIATQYGNLVPAIQNRDNTGFCPMESTVLHIDDPKEALSAVKQTLSDLAK